MAATNIKVVLDEAARAVAFHDKCLFYSNDPDNIGLFEVYDYADFLDEKDATLDGKGKTAQKKALGGLAIDFSDEINTLYITGMDLLVKRLEDATEKYKKALRAVKAESIEFDVDTADRDIENAVETRYKALEKFSHTHKFIKDSLVESIATNSPCADFSTAWLTLRETGMVAMQEISHLSQRVDQFQQFRVNNINFKHAGRSFKAAAISLIVTCVIALLSWRFPVSQNSNKLEIAPKTDNSETYLKKISTDCDALNSSVKTLLSRPQSLAIDEDYIKNLQSILENLQKQLNALETAPKPNSTTPAPTPNIQPILHELDEINKSLIILKEQVAKKEMPSNNKRVIFNVDHY